VFLFSLQLFFDVHWQLKLYIFKVYSLMFCHMLKLLLWLFRIIDTSMVPLVPSLGLWLWGRPYFKYLACFTANHLIFISKELAQGPMASKCHS
jgi:hypothetical protein